MDDADLVNILDSCQDLLHETDCFAFVQPLLFHDMIEQFSSRSVFHNEVDVGFGLDDLNQERQYLIELHDVRVPQDFQDADFASDSLDICLFCYFFLLQSLDCYFFSCRQMYP